jgi:hypothetical protein
VNVCFLKRQLAGLNFGELQNVIADEQQVAAGVVYFVPSLCLLGRQPVPAQQVIETPDGVHGSANFTAHVVQENTFGPVRRIGLLARQYQLLCGLGDYRFQVVAVVFQLGIQTLPRPHRSR